LCGFKIIL